MPKKVQLITYQVQVLENDDHAGYDLAAWPDGSDFCTLVDRFLQRTAGVGAFAIDALSEKVFISDLNYQQRRSNRVYGILRSGDYGVTAEGYNIDTGDQAYVRGQRDTEVVPLYFQLRTFPGVNWALLALQKFGRRSVKTQFENKLREYIGNQYEQEETNPKLRFRPLAPRNYLYQMIRGGVREVQFIEYSRTGDITDRVRNAGLVQEESSKKTIFTAERGGNFRQFQDYLIGWLNNGRSKSEMVSLTDIEYDDMKVEVRMGDSTRVINLSRPDLVGKFDVTGQIVPQVNDNDVELGHPTFSSIHGVADEIIGDLIDDLGVPQ